MAANFIPDPVRFTKGPGIISSDSDARISTVNSSLFAGACTMIASIRLRSVATSSGPRVCWWVVAVRAWQAAYVSELSKTSAAKVSKPDSGRGFVASPPRIPQRPLINCVCL
jgi:hypothetical protein